MRNELEIGLAPASALENPAPLVGEIAHDINHLLTVVAGSALRLRERPELSPIAHDLAQITSAAQRAAELARQLLAVDGGLAELTLIDLGDAIRRLEPTIRLLLAGDIVLDFRHFQPAPSVLIEPARFEQILMNLIMNASDAMVEGGTLMVSTQPRTVSALQAQRRGITAGAYVLMSVGDTGTGIELDARDRIFDPLFTTKSGSNTGMGLTSVRGAVRQAGGRVDVDSDPGRGTTFRVLLPAASQASQADPATEAGPPHETVLLAEDEPALRRLLLTALKRAE